MQADFEDDKDDQKKILTQERNREAVNIIQKSQKSSGSNRRQNHENTIQERDREEVRYIK